jgi:hypothetical protein
MRLILAIRGRSIAFSGRTMRLHFLDPLRPGKCSAAAMA